MKHTLPALLLALILLLGSCSFIRPTVDTEAPTETLAASGESPSVSDGHPDGTSHADADDDGTCDVCAETVLVIIDLFSINDLHGKLADTDKQPGVDELTTYLKTAAAGGKTIILSAGDMWQGSSESNLTEGLILTDWMNELDFVSMTLGNHEFDWGEDAIEANAALAEFPLLAINVYDRDTGERVEYCQGSVLVERGGARIGIIGAVGDCYSSISGEVSGGIYFKTGAELTALVKAESEKLRAEGADFIVYSLHDGYGDSRMNGYILDNQLASYYDPTLSEGYVDIVFEGHTHQKYVLPDEEGVYHIQNGGENRGIARVKVKINVANGNTAVDSATVVDASIYDDAAPDPIVEELMEKYKDQVSVGSEVLGTNAATRSSDELRRLVASLYLEAGETMWGEDYDIVLGGGFLSVRAPYSLSPGDVTYAQLQSLLPFDNTLVLCSVKGSDLQSKFIYTNNGNYFIHYSAYGESVKDSIDPNATYYIIVDTYTSTYAPNRLTEVARYTADVYARDLLADHIRSGGLA